MCYVNIYIQYNLTFVSHHFISAHLPPFKKYMPRTMRTFFLQLCSYKCVLSIFIYNKALQITDFGVLQKSSKAPSKHFLISIFFQIGRGDAPSLTLPPLATSCLEQGTIQFTPPPLPPNPGSATDCYNLYGWW